MVIQFALVALVCEGIMVAVLLGRPDIIDPTTLALVAMFTWPWLVVVGAAIGYLVPHFFFADDKQD